MLAEGKLIPEGACNSRIELSLESNINKLCNVVVTLESLDDVVNCKHSNETLKILFTHSNE